MNIVTMIIIAALAAFVIFLLAPALLIFFAVFGRKKALPFEEYDMEKFKNHYYIPERLPESARSSVVWCNSYLFFFFFRLLF